MTIFATIDGLTDIEQQWQRGYPELFDFVGEVIENGAVFGQELIQTQGRTPRDTGFYQDFTFRAFADSVNHAEYGTDEPYGWRLERGYTGPDSLGRTFQQRAQPHVEPTMAPTLDFMLGQFAQAGFEVG